MRLIAKVSDFPAYTAVGGGMAGHIDGILFVAANANIDYVDQNGKTGLAVPDNQGPGGWCMHRQQTDGKYPCFQDAGAMEMDPFGNLYVLDAGLVRTVAPDRSATTVASFYPSNGYAISPKGFPAALTIDASGNVYVAVMYTEAAAEHPGETFVKKISPDGKITDVISGFPFKQLFGIRVDANGTLYLNDNGLIYKRTSDGAMKLIADASLPFAQGSVTDMVLDSRGNMYVTSNYYPDNTPHWSVKRITPSGAITTFLDKCAINGPLIGSDVMPVSCDDAYYAVDLK